MSRQSHQSKQKTSQEYESQAQLINHSESDDPLKDTATTPRIKDLTKRRHTHTYTFIIIKPSITQKRLTIQLQISHIEQIQEKFYLEGAAGCRQYVNSTIREPCTLHRWLHKTDQRTKSHPAPRATFATGDAGATKTM